MWVNEFLDSQETITLEEAKAIIKSQGNIIFRTLDL
jgi:hypothetical protein